MIDIRGQLYLQKLDIGWENKERYISVNSCGYQKLITRSFNKIRNNGRIDYQILYIARGKGRYLVNDELIRVSEGSVVLYCPGQRQEYYCQPDNTEVYWIHFTGSHAEKIVKDLSPITKIGLSNTIIQLFGSIIHSLQIRRPMFDDIADALFLQLVASIKRRSLEKGGKKRDKDIEHLVIQIQNNYNNKWTLESMADMLGISKFYLIHKFKEYMGLSPISYVAKIRIDKAKELLSESDMRINKISTVLGYENPLYFSRLFANNTGLPPAEYRKNSAINTNLR